MTISKVITPAALKSLSLMIKATDVDIRTHDTENIPSGPLLFVVNHFTRIETIFMPSVLYEVTGKLPYSLAFHELFQGSLGKVMSSLGAISTKDPNRDKVFISALLKGDMSVIIYPEGQMIKDKKIIERGKFVVYNSGIRRPPHTGSARLALIAEFYRKKIAYFLQSNNREGAVAIAKEYDIPLDNLEAIASLKTNIVPVNITYYPVRARENAIERFVEKMAHGLSERFEEELEVEGNMLLDGVDIDINFGQPINAEEYLLNEKAIVKSINDIGSFLSKEERKKALPLVKPGNALTQTYMRAIYNMTTVNHDHIISWFIASYPQNTIEINDLKNRVYLAIKDINIFNLASAHTTLYKNQEFLVSDDHHDKFSSLIETAKEHGLIKVYKNTIVRNPARFSQIYEFHTIRKNNIIEVLKNEIEPLSKLIRHLRKIMFISPIMLRKKIVQEFITRDMTLFEEEFNRYNPPSSTVQKSIGSPFFLKGFMQKKGVLLIHGYMAAPEEVRLLGEYLYNKGYAVYGVRLAGHGTSPEDLAHRTWEEWYNSVNNGYIVLKNSCKSIAVAGFSTGAGLALLQASRKEKIFTAAISISAPLKLQNIQSRFASVVTVWNKLLETFHVNAGKLVYVDNHPENPHINYHKNPVSGVYQLELLMKEVSRHLQDITKPVLVVQGSEDPVVDPQSATEIFEHLGTEKKELFRIFSRRHGIVRGDTLSKVGRHIITFLEE